MLTCPICGKECKQLRPHLKVHKLTTEKFQEIYPGHPMISEETRKNLSMSHKGVDIDPNEWAKDLDESEFVTCQLCGDKFRLITWKHCRKHDMTTSQYDEIFGEGSRVSESSSKKLRDSAKHFWDSPEFEDKRSNIKRKFVGRMSFIHRKVSWYLDSIGISHKNEVTLVLKDKSVVRVDILLDEGTVIEVNGEDFHGRHDQSIETMTERQYDGYLRDMKKLDVFDKVIFLWESDIRDNFDSKIKPVLDMLIPSGESVRSKPRIDL